MKGTAAAALLLLLAPAVARAQDPRPSEADIFGAPAPAEAPKGEAPKPPSEGDPTAKPGAATQGGAEGEGAKVPPASLDPRDHAILGAPEAGPTLSEEAAPADPLRIGGQFYLRAQSTMLEEQSPKNWALSSPNLLDAYFDARPNQQVRGFVLGRMFYDPTLPRNNAPRARGPVATAGMSAEPGTQGSTPFGGAFGGQTRGPTVVLDQLWLRFDIKRTVFVTAGKQHVRWGTARFWTPTDFLHVNRRNPLDVFDARTGTTMLKLHVPWEARGWNFYAYGVLEGLDATRTLGDVAGAARAEIVLGTSELGLGAFLQRGHKPKLAADLSTGIGLFDLYGEIALRYGSEIDRVRFESGAMLPPVPMRPEWQSEDDFNRERLETITERFYPTFRSHGIKPQVTGGFSFQHQYADKDVLIIGGEYFYNALGYDGPSVIPGLILARPRALEEPAAFFYLGRHYAALFVSLPSPYSWDLTTFTLSTLANLSDLSAITRLDYALVLLTHLRFEAFVSLRYGNTSGEFRLGVRDLTLGPLVINQEPMLLDLGVALRVNL